MLYEIYSNIYIYINIYILKKMKMEVLPLQVLAYTLCRIFSQSEIPQPLKSPNFLTNCTID